MILLFLGNLFINVKTLEILGGFAPLAPPYQGFAMDPLGALNGPQTHRPIILNPPFLI